MNSPTRLPSGSANIANAPIRPTGAEMELGGFSVSLAVEDLGHLGGLRVARFRGRMGDPSEQEADESSTGPASFIVVDPDGNPIFVGQHV